jgi:hypothetical protein
MWNINGVGNNERMALFNMENQQISSNGGSCNAYGIMAAAA